MAQAPGGIKKKKGGNDIAVPQFAVPEKFVDGIAQVIVDAWQGKPSLDKIMERHPPGPKKGMATQAAIAQATAAINAAAPGFGLKRAIIITEDEHDDGYTVESDDDVVFVLPKFSRSDGATNLLNTARLLMACTPNGI